MAPTLKQLTPVMIVDKVDPCIAFWVDRFGFDAENSVPGPDGATLFASAKKGDIEVMYQTRASVLAESPNLASEINGNSIVLFLTVDNIDETEAALAGAPVIKPRHQTFYGSTEIYVKEPGGNTVGFAAFGS